MLLRLEYRTFFPVSKNKQAECPAVPCPYELEVRLFQNSGTGTEPKPTKFGQNRTGTERNRTENRKNIHFFTQNRTRTEPRTEITKGATKN